MKNHANIRQAKEQLLKNVPFFAGLTRDEVEDIEQLITIRQFSRGEIVLFEEDTPNYMYIVLSGKVRVVNLSEQGKEHMLAIHKRGDYFGEMSLFDGKTAPATVISMEDSRIGLLSRSDFERLVMQNEKVLRQFINMLCLRLRESWLMLKIMSFADAEQRVRAVLKNIGQLYGVRDQRGVLVALKLTHRDIASFAAVSRETVSRLLSKFTKDGEIEILENKTILIKSSFLNNQIHL
jgi:CRP/FNR family transcriptional regulator